MSLSLERLTGADTVVLCVHGIQGNPSKFLWLTRRLPAEIDYLCVLLPGHGISSKEFAQSGSKEWLDFLRHTLQELSQKYRRIICVGHSMGSLLGILAASDRTFPALHGLMLLSCPFSLGKATRYAVGRWFTGLFSEVPKLKTDDEDTVSARLLQHPMYPKPYLGLFQLMSMARRQLSMLKLPVFAVHSDGDEIVSPRSLELLARHARARTVVVPESGHFLYSEAAQQMIIDGLFSLLGNENT